MNYKDAFDAVLEPETSAMFKLDETGDSRVTWNRGSEVETEIARKSFKAAKKGGYMAYKITGDGKKGEILADFDPAAEKIILAPPMAGGTCRL